MNKYKISSGLAAVVLLVTFFAAMALFSMAWGLVVDGVSLVVNSLKSLISIINTYLSSPINYYLIDL